MKDLSRHLLEAIHLNTERMPLYGALTAGKTLPFSKKLIGYERIALKGAWIFDRIGDQYQKKGIPYIQAEFVEMSLVSPFSKSYPVDINYQQPIKKINLTTFRQATKDKIKKRAFDDLVQISNLFLEDLNQQPHVYCLLRHLIESFRRIAFLVPIHQKKCTTLDLKFPIQYSLFLLKVHLLLLGQSKRFDEAIAPIQNAGVPFIFQDLPAIDLEL